MLSHPYNVWALIVAGVLIWVIGQKLFSSDKYGTNKSGFSKFVCGLGILIAIAGVGIGILGPIEIGGVMIHSFGFTEARSKSSVAALNYAHSNLTVSAKPSSGWHGASKKKVEFTVMNRGKKGIRFIKIVYPGGKRGVDVRVRGPFPAGRTVRKVIDVSSSIDRTQFNGSTISPNQIVSASF